MDSAPSLTVKITLPSRRKCAVEECKVVKLKGRGLCARHYVSEWLKGEHVFRPRLKLEALEQVRVHVYQTDFKRIDALASQAGLTRSEFLRDVLHSVVTASYGE